MLHHSDNNEPDMDIFCFPKCESFLELKLTFKSRPVLPIASSMIIWVPFISMGSFELGLRTPANFPSSSYSTIDCKSRASIDLQFINEYAITFEVLPYVSGNNSISRASISVKKLPS